MNHSPTVDWKTLVLQSDWLARLDRLAAKRFGEGGLAEEASSYVIEKLSTNDWSIFKSYKGQSKPETYLHTLANNSLEEFSRKRFGRPRPPEWLKRQGDLWIKVWKMVCLERRLPQTIIDLLCVNELREPVSINNILQTVKARIPTCGESVREVSSVTIKGDDENDLSAEDLIPQFNTPEASIETDHLQDVMVMLASLINPDVTPATIENASAKATAAVKQDDVLKVKKLGEKLDLTDQEWVILRMVYQDGIKLNVTASTLGLKSHEPGRIIKRCLGKIHDALSAIGVDRDHFIGLLE